MKLHTGDGITPVTQPHYLILWRPGGDPQTVGQRLGHDQGMVARGVKRGRESTEKASSVVMDRRYLAMHQPLCPYHLPAECLPYYLVSQTDAQDGHATGETLDQGQRDASIFRGARPGRDDDVRRSQCGDLVQADSVVTDHLHLRSQFTQILRQVIGKAVVIINK